jgi:hypothetical protein
MRFLVLLQLVPMSFSLLGSPSSALAQSSASIHVEVSKQDLAQYEGTYQYRDGLILVMVSNGSQLFALIDDSKYTLRSSGNDAFLNPVAKWCHSSGTAKAALWRLKSRVKPLLEGLQLSLRLHVCAYNHALPRQREGYRVTDIRHLFNSQMVLASVEPERQPFPQR